MTTADRADAARRREARAVQILTELMELEHGVEAALDAACAGDDALRARVVALLERDASTADVFSDAAGWIGRDLLAVMAADREEPLPERIGRFRVLSRLGRGGMGVVYEAEQDKPRRRVAIKVLDPGLAGLGRARRFEREQQALARLQHPGIATILETGTMATAHGELPWFAMELVDGAPITVYADRARLDVRKRLALLADLCDAVHHAHEHAVLHRDLKPDNVLVDDHGRVKVLDFGVARLIDPETAAQTLITETGALLGTLAYMAPEQLGADVSRVGPASDVYALGVLAYELLCGRRPHELAGLPIQAAARLIAEQDAPRLGQHDTRLRGDIETVVLEALEKEPDRRYPSAAMFGADLRRILVHEPIRARPPTLTYRLRRFSRRHRGLVAALVALTAGAAVSLALAVRSDRLADLADERRLETLAETVRAEELAYRSSLVAASLSVRRNELGARRRLDDAPPGLRGWEWRHLSARLQPRERWITSAGCPAFDLVLCDSAPWVATSSWETGLTEVFDVTDGSLVGSVSVLDGIVMASRFRDGGRRLVVVSLRHGGGLDLRVRDLETHKWVERRHVPPASLPRIVDTTTKFSPSADGRWLALSLYRSLTYVLDTATGALEALPPELSGGGVGRFVDDSTLLFFPDAPWLLDVATDRSTVPPFMPVKARPLRGDTGFVHPVGTDQSRSELVLYSSGDLLRLGLLPPVDNTALAPGNDALAAVLFRTKEVATLDVASGEVRAVLGRAGAQANLEFAVGGDVLVLRDVDGLRAWDRPFDDPSQLVGHESYVYGLAVTRDGTLLASAGWDGTVRLWDTVSGAPVATWRLAAPDAKDAAFLHGVVLGPDGETLITHGDAGTWALDLAHGRAAWETDRTTRFAALDPSGERLATAYNATVRLLDARDGRELATSVVPDEEHEARWYATYPLLWSHDGNAVSVASGWGGAIETFDGRTLASRGSIPADHTASLDRLGDGLLHDAPGEGVRLIDAVTGRILRRYPHEHEVLALASSPDGTRLVTGDRSGMVRVWDAEAGTELVQLSGHTDYVKDLAWTPDGRTLFSASGDGTIRVWDSWPLRERSRALREWHEVARRLRPEIARRFGQDVAAGHATDVGIAERVADLGDTDRERQIARQLLLGMRLDELWDG